MESYSEQKSYCERIRANQRAEEYRKYEKLSDYEKCRKGRNLFQKLKDFNNNSRKRMYNYYHQPECPAN